MFDLNSRRSIIFAGFLISSTILLIGCIEKTIRTGVPNTAVDSTPPTRVEDGIKIVDFQKICNFIPDEGDTIAVSEVPDGKIVRITLGNTKKRQFPAAVRAGCTPGATFEFRGPELKMAAPASGS
ncbi:MAG: hypothetical protein ABI539_12880 [Acidobacteriota bacterium]